MNTSARHIVTAPSGSMAGIVRTTCLGSRRYTGDGHVLLSGDMVARDSVPGLSRAAAATPLRLEESRFGDGFFDAGGNDMYYIRDWQGNVAAVADGEGNVVQRTGYYPYGMPWRPLDTGSSNRVLFGGKEYHTADGLDEYDFGARRHYPRFPAFTTPDPHADNTPWLSPYVFCAANPVAYVDPSGMDIFAVAGGLIYTCQKIDGEYKFVNDKINLPNEFLTNLENAINTLASQSVGEALVSKLVNSSTATTITESHDENGIDSNNVVYWNPESNTKSFCLVENTDGSIGLSVEKSPNFISLGHELMHAEDGLIYDRPDVSPWFYINTSNGPLCIPMMEKYAVMGENYLRTEHNLPIRNGYGIESDFRAPAKYGMLYNSRSSINFFKSTINMFSNYLKNR